MAFTTTNNEEICFLNKDGSKIETEYHNFDAAQMNRLVPVSIQTLDFISFQYSR